MREGGQIVGPLNQSVNGWGLPPEWGEREYLWAGSSWRLRIAGKRGSWELLSANSWQLTVLAGKGVWGPQTTSPIDLRPSLFLEFN